MRKENIITAVIKRKCCIQVKCGTVIYVVYAHYMDSVSLYVNSLLIIAENVGSDLFQLRDITLIGVMLACYAVNRIACGD